MKKNLAALAVLLVAFVLSSCATPDKEGWRYGQKSEFLDILETDKYLSICDKQGLYAQVKESRDSVLMSRMLVAYAENLANSCIDLEHFEEGQKQRKARGIETHYEVYTQKVDIRQMAMKLRGGESIESILAPYIPKNEQFGRLLEKYHALVKSGTATQKQLDTLRINIERVKLMNDNLGNDYALANIPEFMVRTKKDGKTALKFRIIVGKRHLQTPVFAAPMQYVTLNPQWSVPDSIARNEIIPEILKDPEYLKKNRMVIRSNYHLHSDEMNLTVEDLQAYNGGKGEVPFKFIEVPSNRNVLGRVKFIFPNKHSVYMHDTQTKRLFNKKVRAYSHGCVRLQKPMELLKYISTHYTDESYEQVRKWYNSYKTHHLKLTHPVMVHTAYLTAYVEDDGKLLMFNDIYRYDKSQRLNL
jgi:hypothetical protein